MEAPDFWNDIERSNEVMKIVKTLKDTLAAFDTVSDEYEELGVLIEMAEEENDSSLVRKSASFLKALKSILKHFVFKPYYPVSLIRTMQY